MRALELLNYIGALDDEGDLTQLGSQMSEFPLDPQFAAVLLNSVKYKCPSEVLSIVSMLSIPNPFLRPRNNRQAADDAKANFDHVDGDHLTLLNVYNSYKEYEGNDQWCWNNYLNSRSMKSAENVRVQLARIMGKLGIELISNPPSSKNYYENIRKALLSGFFMQVAHLEQKGQYTTVKDSQVFLNAKGFLIYKMTRL